MADDPTHTFAEHLHLLHQDYLQRLPAKLAALQASWQSLLDSDGDSEALQTFYRNVHSLAGSSATHRLDALSDALRQIEHTVQAAVDRADTLSTEAQRQISAWLHTVAEMVGTIAPATPPLHPTPPAHPTPPPTGHTDYDYHLLTPDPTRNRRIFLVEDDTSQAQDLALQIGHFGYDVSIFHTPHAMKQQLQTTRPAAIIMDIVFPQDRLAGIEAIQDVQHMCAEIPVMFMSIRDDILARLQAVRVGGKAYFTKPVNIATLIDTLDELTNPTIPEPYRILIVDDDPDIGALYEQVLQHSAMETLFVKNPLLVMQPLIEFHPDLILMDVHMPECNGLELASVIRQQETFVGIPIVFLSTVTDVDEQLQAMGQGGDDFLTKDIQPEHLISAVQLRAQRSRMLRTTMVRDSLTGLLNHTTTKQQLAREVIQARRRHTSLSFAMLDIDKFKMINDSYGHPTGDRVIKSLSRMLQQRLRRTDIIGRYGGEEFAVMLPDTKGPTAVKVLDEIRADFAQIRQYTETDEFRVTFSCGIADFPTFQDPVVINKVADDALYRAKRQGRNCVVLAE